MSTNMQYLSPFFEQLNQGVQVAQHLTQAAQQQRQLDFEKMAQQQRMDLANREFDANQQGQLMSALQNGAKTVDSNGNLPAVPTASAGPLASPTALPSAPAGSTPGDGGYSFSGDLMSNLQNGGASSALGGGAPMASASPTSLPANLASSPRLQFGMQPEAGDPSMQVRLAGRTVQAPSLQDQLSRTAAMKEASADATRVPITKEGADLIGNIFPVGTKVDPAHMPGLASLARAKQAADAGKDTGKVIQHSQIIPSDNGGQTLVTQYTDGSVDEKPLKARGKSDKFDPANAAASAQNNATKQQTENNRQDMAKKAHDDYLKLNTEKAAIERENANLQIALDPKNGGVHYVDKDGNLTAFEKGGTAGTIPDDARDGIRQSMQAKYQANMQRLPQVISDMQGAQNTYADLSGKQGARPTAGAQSPPAPTATPQQKPAAAQGTQPKPTKRATMANIQAYAQHKYGNGKPPTPAQIKQAQKEFESAGYQVTQ